METDEQTAVLREIRDGIHKLLNVAESGEIKNTALWERYHKASSDAVLATYVHVGIQALLIVLVVWLIVSR